jgi:hypothetical protein
MITLFDCGVPIIDTPPIAAIFTGLKMLTYTLCASMTPDADRLVLIRTPMSPYVGSAVIACAMIVPNAFSLLAGIASTEPAALSCLTDW